MMHDFLHQVTPAGILFFAFRPTMRDEAEAIAAGRGCRAGSCRSAARHRRRSRRPAGASAIVYVSVALAGIAVMALSASRPAGPSASSATGAAQDRSRGRRVARAANTARLDARAG